ncbi:response regulator transcription factor [Anaerocolumna jejuensis]|uniref:response regulator transcription factor n=1 Tax=Anaerocolumna jejuensis TaxID=259063 RepID=UPI003F7C7E1B
MNLLIVDDQPMVVEGILAGVDWELITIDKKFTANNIIEAKNIIQTHQIELLLCDIEMPMGSGLDLYEWVLEQHYTMKCIFLTAHSDFSYAQKAVHLQGFDYLLQPVTYKEIEGSLQKAIDQIKMDTTVKSYYNYALDLKKREKQTLSSLLREYLLALRSDVKEVVQYVSVLSYTLEADSSCEILMIQLFDFEGERWENDLLFYAIDNIWNELLTIKIGKLIVICLDSEHFILLYQKQDERLDLKQKMILFMRTAEQLFRCKIALYPGKTTIFSEIPDEVKRLEKRSRKNVIKKDGILEAFNTMEMGQEYISPDCNKWAQYIKDGYYDLLKEEACKYLDCMTQSGRMNDEALRKFHKDYVYLFWEGIKNSGNVKSDLYMEGESDYNYEALMNSYTSVIRMKSLIVFTMNYLKGMDNQENFNESRMDEILDYIHKNIQKNITRKDIAEAVYLNPEYLSRLFKKEKGIKLSDYIQQEKMNIANHLLRTTNFSVSIVASKVGYSNFSHFAQSFKRVFGISPSEIKQENHK